MKLGKMYKLMLLWDIFYVVLKKHAVLFERWNHLGFIKILVRLMFYHTIRLKYYPAACCVKLQLETGNAVYKKQ